MILWVRPFCKSMRQSLEDITFTYYGMRNQKFDVTAVCQTEGGPEQLGELKWCQRSPIAESIYIDSKYKLT